MNPFTNLPPGCRDSDIPGNQPDTYAYCKGCECEFNTDDLDDDGLCEKCVLLCQCGNPLDIKDHSRCSACEQDRVEFEADCRENR